VEGVRKQKYGVCLSEIGMLFSLSFWNVDIFESQKRNMTEHKYSSIPTSLIESRLSKQHV